MVATSLSPVQKGEGRLPSTAPHFSQGGRPRPRLPQHLSSIPPTSHFLLPDNNTHLIPTFAIRSLLAHSSSLPFASRLSTSKNTYKMVSNTTLPFTSRPPRQPTVACPSNGFANNLAPHRAEGSCPCMVMIN
jgi:hypothetical protein